LGCRRELPKVSFSNTVRLKSDDVVLLCSDGLWGPLDDVQMGAVLADQQPLETALNTIAERSERLSYPRSDNISALGLRLISTEEGQQSKQSKRSKRQDGKRHDNIDDAIAQIEAVIREYEEEFER
ncbi:MAG: hypothetical protein ACQETD_04010, partial [Pseudomonadota bacterium]